MTKFGWTLLLVECIPLTEVSVLFYILKLVSTLTKLEACKWNGACEWLEKASHPLSWKVSVK